MGLSSCKQQNHVKSEKSKKAAGSSNDSNNSGNVLKTICFFITNSSFQDSIIIINCVCARACGMGGRGQPCALAVHSASAENGSGAVDAGQTWARLVGNASDEAWPLAADQDCCVDSAA